MNWVEVQAERLELEWALELVLESVGMMAEVLELAWELARAPSLFVPLLRSAALLVYNAFGTAQQ